MRIDPQTGEVVIGAVHIGSDLAEDDFLNFEGKSAKLVRSTTIQNWYEVWLPDPSSGEAGMVLAFSPGGKLKQIRLKLLKPETRVRGVWSATAENEMKLCHDRLLREQLGDPPYDFNWGWATSVIDDHDYSAVIILAYGPRPK